MPVLPQVSTIVQQYFIMLLITYSGASTASTAEKAKVIVGSLLIYAEKNEEVELIKLLLQIQTRNLKIRNIFFIVDWNILVTVIFISYGLQFHSRV